MGRHYSATGKTWDDSDLAEPHKFGQQPKWKPGREPDSQPTVYRVAAALHQLNTLDNPYEHRTLAELPVEKHIPDASQLRAFGDVPATRQLIFDNMLQAAQSIQPITNQRHSLELSDVGYAGPETFSKAERKQAVLSRGTLARRLRGTWTMKDALSGEPVAKKTVTLAHVPYMTDDGTFVQNGNEYSLAHQLRLRSGQFARRKANGEIEAHINVLPGKGRSHRLYLDPETGVFKVHLAQANIPLLPLMRSLGAQDRRMVNGVASSSLEALDG